MLKVALRNLTRQMRRTLLTGLLFALATASLVVNASAANGISRMIDESVQRYLTGNVRIVSTQNKWELGKLQAGEVAPLANWREVEAALGANPDVSGFARRVSYTAVLLHDGKRVFATVYGTEGQGAPVLPVAVSEGEGLGDTRGGILISRNQAQKVGAGVGDTVTLLATDRSGRPHILSLRVRGIVSTVNYDMFRQAEAHIAYGDAQELFGLDGAPTEYIVATARSEAVAAGLTTALSSSDVRVQTWDVAGREFLSSKDQLAVSVLAMFLLFGIVIAAIIFNMMQLQVHERVREIGTMSSLGMTWPQILFVLLTETLLLGVGAGAVGGGSVYAAVRVIALNGIHWGTAPAAVLGGTVLTPAIAPGTVALFIAGLTLLGVAGAFLPALRASRAVPAESLRYS